MQLNLKRPLIIFDLETTGLEITKAEIIQISFIKVFPDGHEERGNSFIRPTHPIPEKVRELTHISQEDVDKALPFKGKLGERIAEVFSGCDLCGYNSNNFDVPMLAEEFARYGINFDFSQCHLIDAAVIFKKMEQRTLAAAYKFFCGRKMEDDFQAHRSDQDTEATYKVFLGELEMYSKEKQTEADRILIDEESDKDMMEQLADFSQLNRNIDFAGRIIWDDKKDANGNIVRDEKGEPVQVETFNFGKHKGVPVEEVLRREPGYYNWMQNGDFAYNTKQVLTRIYLKYNTRK